MQQRGSNTTMETGEPDTTAIPTSRSRQNSKLKVLVRSHAFREETSPPRELLSPSTYHQAAQAQQPCIKLIPSPDGGGGCRSGGGGGGTSPVVVLSPTSSSRGLSPDAATVVPSAGSVRCSPTSNVEDGGGALPDHHQDHLHEIPSPKYMNKVNNARNLELPKQSSHNSLRKKYSCDCPNQMCINCPKLAEANLNNNNLTNINNNNTIMGSNPNMLSVSRARGKLRQQSSSQGSFESSSNSPCLSRDSSSEQYTDTTGVDLEQFIPETLNRNAKDRALMLRIEQELVNLAKDRSKTHYKFPPMSSYQRMLVHRCAAYFGMEHNVEPTGKSVVVNKTKATRIPEMEFKNYIREDAVFTEEPRRSILKRDSNSIEDYSLENRRSKSFEEREEEYEKARRRIFNRELHDGSSEDFGWSEIPWSSTESDYSTRFRLLPPDCHRRQFGKLIKVHSEDTAETMRPFVAKSYSFGGYGGNISVLTRGDSVVSTHSAGPRLLTKQDSGASSVSWRLSPSSSGYKSQSQMSESVTPSPTSTPHPVCDSSTRQDSSGGDEESVMHQGCLEAEDNQIVWAVTDIQSVPKGTIIINPQTGRPFQNEDGSVYHFDPNNILPGLQLPGMKPQSPQSHTEKENITSSPKKTRSQRLSPTRKSHLTNSSTSPSLPFSPPPQPQLVPPTTSSSHPQRNSYSYSHSDSSLPSMHHPQHHFGNYTAYSSAASSGAETSGPYQQPYIVYATSPYGVHMAQQYDGRMEAAPVPEMGTYFIQDGGGPPPSQPLSYPHTQPPPYWNQPITYYPNGPQGPSATPPQRYPAGPMPAQSQQGYFQPAYIPPPQATVPSQQQPTNPPAEYISVYPNPHMQIVYQSQPAPTASANPMVYQGQAPVIYASTQTPIYQQQSAPYPPQQMTPQMGAQTMTPYPQGTPTPNSCTSSVSGPVFPVAPTDPQSFVQLAQGMQQMSLGSQTPPHGFTHNRGSFEFRHRHPNKNYNGSNKPRPSSQQQSGFGTAVGCSSQSSTGTSSPATTVVAAAPMGFANYSQHHQHYRTPPDTPPAHYTPTFAANFNMPPPSHGPVIYKPMGNMRVATPGTARSSRSPTPASDISHYERQRMSLPPNLYQGMPYVMSSDPRFVSGKGPPNMYRQSCPMSRSSFIQGSDSRSHRNRKSKAGNKQQGLPPSGK